ncbi:hypothetical protein FOS14_03150 [Skermania sp. ID1734]|uniref:hypothetical protein n=1 Tax=Skermania sp. ID1734 TaxID=2597516 RepID=UPI001181424A|nr:hypothetical protein [Skermania sp. ID1734]TSE01550.1 hypothetical protein FOS14_03150 [Skermania sp. ID1734]
MDADTDFELSHQAAEDLDQQKGKSAESGDEKDPVEQTIEVPKDGSDEEAVKSVQQQYKEKSGLELGDDVAREISDEVRGKQDTETQDKEPKDEESASDKDD